MGTITYQYSQNTGYRYRIEKYKAKQAKPIDRSIPLRYGVLTRVVMSCYGSGPWAGVTDWANAWFWGEDATMYGWSFSSSGPSTNLPTHGPYNAAYAKAYGRFMDSVRGDLEQSQILTALAERHETFGMVLNRMNQLYEGARLLKAGKLRDFFKHFGITPKKKHSNTRWSRPQDFSALWLEYWFGWAPTVSDLMNAFETYEASISDGWIIARGGAAMPIKQSWSSSGNGYSAMGSNDGFCRVRLAGRVKVDNAMLYKLGNLGLLNPVSTAFELIPFSWFAGWFGNIAQVLSQSTDLVGLKLQDLTLSVKAEWTHSHACTYTGVNPGRVERTFRQEQYTRNTLTALPRVSLVWAIPPKLSPTRGATLASLIVQLFSPTGKK